MAVWILKHWRKAASSTGSFRSRKTKGSSSTLFPKERSNSALSSWTHSPKAKSSRLLRPLTTKPTANGSWSSQLLTQPRRETSKAPRWKWSPRTPQRFISLRRPSQGTVLERGMQFCSTKGKTSAQLRLFNKLLMQWGPTTY